MEQSERKGEVTTALRGSRLGLQERGEGGMAGRLGGEGEARGNLVRPGDNAPSLNYPLQLGRGWGGIVRTEDFPHPDPTPQRMQTEQGSQEKPGQTRGTVTQQRDMMGI